MKRVWTTKKSGSHLADTPAHLWPSESSHHDRPHTSPLPPTPSALSLPTSAHLPLGQTTSSGCPVTAKHGSPTVASNSDEEKRESGGAHCISNKGILFVMKISYLCKRQVLLFSSRVKEDYEACLQGRCRFLFLPCGSGACS